VKYPRCQQENPPQAKFCLECATPFALRCANCGTTLPAGAKFCFECATPVSAPGSSPRFASPDAYTPKHLAEKILTSKSALEGERKQVTVLFADLKGSMELLADRDPEEARKILDPVLEHMMDAVHRYEGTVNQVMGDGIMALFGAPVGHEDHAVRACYAALRMHDVVRRLSAELRRAHGVEVQIRVGINSGDVVVRTIGSDLRMDYTAVGQTTHLAARMEQLAAPGTVRLTAGTLQLAEGFVQVTPLGPIPVKGIAEPVEVFELVAAGVARTRLEASARRGLTRFVGRNEELEQLRGALDRARAGRGQVVAVVGEPGVGKSRLLRELTHSHRVHGCRIVQSSSVSYGTATGYLPVIDLLRDYFEIQSRDHARSIREKVTGRVLTLAPALAPVVPALLALLDVPVDEPSWQALDPAQRRQQMLDAVKRLLLRESEVQPLVVVVEDLHWIDAETQTVLDSLVESLPTARLLLLVNYRPEYRHTWGGKTYYRQLRIDPLPPETADELLDALLGSDTALRPLKQLLVERAEANPLFLEESVRVLVDTGVLAGERGAHRLARPVEGLRIPPTVQAILTARIDRLDAETKRLIQVAAVIGKDVPMWLLLVIADAPEHEVRAGIAGLQAAEFIYETRLFPDLEYTFNHALTHEVAYEGLLHDRRRALHARIAQTIERHAGDGVAEHAESLAHHALRGELWDKAVFYLRQAGRRAMARGANREAVACLEQALACVRHLPGGRETTELTIDLRIDTRNALFPLGERARMQEHVQEAEGLARSLGDQHRLARIATFMVIERLSAGDYGEAARFGQEALSIARALGDLSLEILATPPFAMTHIARGRLDEAVASLERNIALEGEARYERFGMPGIISAVWEAWLAEALSQLGRFDEAIRHAEAAVQIAESANHPWTLNVGLFSRGLAHLRRGEVQRASRDLERGVEICRTWQIFATPGVAAALGVAYTLAGRADEAIAVVAEGLDGFRRHENYVRPAFVFLCAAMSALSAGRVDEAASHAHEALGLARRLGARASEAHALCLAGDVASAAGAGKAEAYYREALALAEELGMRPLIAHCHLGLGRLYRRTEKREQAQEHLTTATAMYREMGMTYWMEKAEAWVTEQGGR
jgi:class 3 adenylate cyclase/tetratricopeptide (TPR) repeat protein